MTIFIFKDFLAKSKNLFTQNRYFTKTGTHFLDKCLHVKYNNVKKKYITKYISKCN